MITLSIVKDKRLELQLQIGNMNQIVILHCFYLKILQIYQRFVWEANSRDSALQK